MVLKYMGLKKVKTITSYAALSRFMAELDPLPLRAEDLEYIESPKTIPFPYSFSATRLVERLNGIPILRAEVAHRKFEVYEILGLESYEKTM